MERQLRNEREWRMKEDRELGNEEVQRVRRTVWEVDTDG